MSYTTTDRPVPGGRERGQRISGREVLVLLLLLGICAGVAAFGAITTQQHIDGWYSRAPHVTWTPPNWLFGVIWTVLYTTIAVAGWLVWLRRSAVRVRGALSLFVAQMVLNSIWTPLFFGGFAVVGPVALWLAVGVIVALDLVVVATIAAFRPISGAAALLLVPYLAWILYASTLNWGDAVLVTLS